MKILQSIRRIFVILGYLADDDRIFRYDFFHTLVSLTILLIVFAMALTSVIYMVRHLQIGDIENSLFASLATLVASMAIGTYLLIIYNKTKLRRVIDDFQKIFDECK